MIYIPGWAFWVVLWGGILAVVYILRKFSGDYNFLSPFLAWGLILFGLAFTLGWTIKGCIG